jgi:DNA-binding response OmpR family regulator
MGACWARIKLGRLLLLVGKRAEGLRVLEATVARATKLGMSVFVGAAERALRDDVLAQVSEAGPSTGDLGRMRGKAVRGAMIAALQAARAGDLAEARQLASASPVPVQAGYGLDRALCALVEALTQRAEGERAAARLALAEATRIAREDGVDADLVPRLVATFGRLRVIDHTRCRLLVAAPPDLGRLPIVIDGRSHRLRRGKRSLALQQRPVLRQLLYVLARRPGHIVTKEALATELWTSSYHPFRHDNPLRVAIRRLRTLIAPCGLDIDFADGGYRLIAPAELVFLDPEPI